MKDMENINKIGGEQPTAIELTEKQIEIFARRILPEIKRFFADENVKREFEEWKKGLKLRTE